MGDTIKQDDLQAKLEKRARSMIKQIKKRILDIKNEMYKMRDLAITIGREVKIGEEDSYVSFRFELPKEYFYSGNGVKVEAVKKSSDEEPGYKIESLKVKDAKGKTIIEAQYEMDDDGIKVIYNEKNSLSPVTEDLAAVFFKANGDIERLVYTLRVKGGFVNTDLQSLDNYDIKVNGVETIGNDPKIIDGRSLGQKIIDKFKYMFDRY